MTESGPPQDNSSEFAGLRARVAELEAEIAVLRRSEAELRAMFRAMTDVVLVMDREGRYLEIAETAPDLLYRPSTELLGKHMHEVMSAEAADFFLTHIHQALERQRVVSMDYSLPIEDQELWFSANISPMSDDTVILVCRNITERKRHEQLLEDNLRQEELLRIHESALIQLSTPLIPISDSIVVMPLVGQLDPVRAEQIMSTMLQGIERSRARFAILDVTGIPSADEVTADTLVRATRVAQLLGARVILTGIRPDVALALMNLRADLSGVIVRGTLQDGIRYAHASESARESES
ncbi:PAS domain-containing protein [Enhygromyxa salina]|uniref:RsbT co-antagonist protein RsbRA n=1 Tax=Enhygromyxa salina TaxID=215803 RepID=A0A2S9YUD6_9BACT|nr:PAS domain-containing protein [Enhygromyxa salina]PRQ08706.1 RsbT co-antagonist protein RsbRA [Enhygromyxa salina]